MAEVLWGFGNERQVYLAARRDAAKHRDFYVSVKDVHGSFIGGVGLCLSRKPAPQCGLIFTAGSLVAGFDAIHAYFATKGS